DHPHTALPALVAATLLQALSVVTAQNVLLLAYVFLNMACAYALAWAITKHARASVLAAVVFGLSPYVAVHLRGHFDLVAAFTLPLFALALRQALGVPQSAINSQSAIRQSAIRQSAVPQSAGPQSAGPQSAVRNPQYSAVAAGLVLAATAYIAYYYVVYVLFFMLVYLAAWVSPIALVAATSPLTPLQSRLRAVCSIVALACAALAAAILATGGRSFWVLDVAVSARTPQNVLTVAWIAAIAAIVVTWRPSVRVSRATEDAWPRALAVGWRVVAAFVVGSSPLLWQAAKLVARGEYVTPEYGWRSIPHGIDLLAPLAGHPLPPLFG